MDNKTMRQGAQCTSYTAYNDACNWFKLVIPDGYEVVFNKPIEQFPGYKVFSIAHAKGIVMVETILNGDAETGRHRMTTKGTEGMNFVIAVADVVESLGFERKECDFTIKECNYEPKLYLG